MYDLLFFASAIRSSGSSIDRYAPLSVVFGFFDTFHEVETPHEASRKKAKNIKTNRISTTIRKREER